MGKERRGREEGQSELIDSSNQGVRGYTGSLSSLWAKVLYLERWLLSLFSPAPSGASQDCPQHTGARWRVASSVAESASTRYPHVHPCPAQWGSRLWGYPGVRHTSLVAWNNEVPRAQQAAVTCPK